MVNWGLKTRNMRPIGLDIGHSYIRMMQLVIENERISVFAADKVHVDPYVNDDAVEKRRFIVSAIKEMLAKGKFCGRDVVSCLQNDKLKITSFRISETKNGEIEEVLRKEATQRFGLDPDKDTVEYMVAGSVQQADEVKDEIIMFAAEQQAINSHIEILEEAGLTPVGIDMVPYALFRSSMRLLRRQEDKEEAIVFVDVGSRFTTVVFGCGGGISFIKQIPIGGEMFNREIAEKLGIEIEEAKTLRHKLQMERAAKEKSDVSTNPAPALQDNLDVSTRQIIIDAISSVAEEIAREISMCFIYYSVTFRGKRVGRAVFTGGEAYESVLLNILRRQLTVEIEVAQPLRGFDMTNIEFANDKRGLFCEWAVVAGLGLKGVSVELAGNRSECYAGN